MKKLSPYYAKNAIAKAHRDREELAKEYGVLPSAVVWIGDNHYIVVKDGKEIKI